MPQPIFAVPFALLAVCASTPGLSGQQEQPLSPLLAPLAARLTATAGASAPSEPPTRFTPSGKRESVAAYVNSLTDDPAQQKSLLTLLETVFKAYEAAAEKAEMPNDLAGALAFYIAANYTAYKGGKEVSEAGSSQIALQIQAALDTPQMRAAKDLEKQDLYEMFLMLGGLLAIRQQSADNAADRNELKPLGADGLRYLRLDPARIAITEQGLQIIPIGGTLKPPVKSGALKTLLFTAPAPWTRKDYGDGISLTLAKEGVYLNSVHTASVVLNGAVPLVGSLQKSFHKYWRDQVLSIMKGQEHPFAMVSMKGSGLRYASGEKSMETRAGGIRWNVTYQLIDAGTVLYPVMILQSENFSDSDGQLDRLLATLRVPGGAPAAKPLATTAELARNWSTGASSVMNYVNAYTGANAGTSVIAYVQSYSLKPTGTYTGSFNGVSNGARINTKEKGTYHLQGNVLTFKASNGRSRKKHFLGIDTPPGATGPIMLLLNPGFPANSANIGLYGEKYGIAPK